MRPHVRRRALLIVAAQAVFALAAMPAWADAGSPLVWAGAFHLLVGNLLVGALEGLVLARVFKLPRARTVGLLIPANYVSAITGAALSGPTGELISRHDPTPLYHLPGLLLAAVFASYVLSAVLEWPFCLAATWRRPDRLRASLKATILAQTVSYPLLAVIYLAGPAVTGPVGVELDRTLSFVREARAEVYFVPSEGGSVWRIHPDGTGRELVARASVTRWDGLTFDSSEPGLWDLWSRQPKQLLVKGVARRPPQPRARQESEAYERGFPFRTDLRPDGEHEWRVIAEPWPDRGLQADNRAHEHLSVALGTPVLCWSARCATVLPEDEVVFELGSQIVLLDLRTRKAGVIAVGGSPAVLLPPD